MTIVRQDLNVNVPVAPPTRFWPNSTGFLVASSFLNFLWTLTIDSSGYAVGQTCDAAVEYLFGSSWIEVVGAAGWGLGPHNCKSVDSSGGVTFVTCSTTSMNATLEQQDGINPTAARLRIDRISSGTIKSLTLALTS